MPSPAELLEVLLFLPEKEGKDVRHLSLVLNQKDVRFGSFYCLFSSHPPNTGMNCFAAIGYELGSIELGESEFRQNLLSACRLYVQENPVARINVQLELLRHALTL